MTHEDIIRMARQAGFCIESIDGDNEVMEGDRYHIQTDVVARFAALVAAAERNACLTEVMFERTTAEIKSAIRARGQA